MLPIPTRNTPLALCAAVLLAAGCADVPAAGGARPMVGERLSSALELVDAQQGFVGETGTVTRVEPDGAYSVSGFVRDRVEPPRRSGQLSPEALARVAAAARAELAAELPARVGAPTGANPRSVRVRYGARDVTLVLPQGADPDAPVPPGDDPAARVLRLRALVTALVERG